VYGRNHSVCFLFGVQGFLPNVNEIFGNQANRRPGFNWPVASCRQKKVEKFMGRSLDAWMNERMENQTGSCIVGRMDRWIGGRIDIHIHRILLQSC